MSNRLISFIGYDDAESFFNSEYSEAYHSKVGPTIEALHKFVKPSNIEELVRKNQKTRILDLFFGLGYNTGTALEYACKINTSPEIEVTAIEKDIEIIKKIKELKVPDWYKKWQRLLSNLTYNIERDYYIANYEGITIRIFIECVFKLINKLPKGSFDIIFFDPFSYKVCSEFWTDEFLTLVFSLLTEGGTLTTYSGLKRVENLANNLGYKATRIKPIGRKKHSLLIKRV